MIYRITLFIKLLNSKEKIHVETIWDFYIIVNEYWQFTKNKSKFYFNYEKKN